MAVGKRALVKFARWFIDNFDTDMMDAGDAERVVERYISETQKDAAEVGR